MKKRFEIVYANGRKSYKSSVKDIYRLMYQLEYELAFDVLCINLYDKEGNTKPIWTQEEGILELFY